MTVANYLLGVEPRLRDFLNHWGAGGPYMKNVHVVGGDFGGYTTVQSAVTAAAAGDTILIAPGEYDEAVSITKSNITLIGVGGRGAVAIAPSTANSNAVKIDGASVARITDVSLVNLGCEGDGTGGGLLVKGDVRRVRAINCKLESGAYGVKLESSTDGAVSDTRLEGCEIAWATNLLEVTSSGGADPVTQTYVDRCLLHNPTDRAIYGHTAHTTDFWVTNSTIAREEDGTAPAQKLVDLAVAGTTGLFGNNILAHATNASAQFAIAAGVLWVANMTEAGVTTARPS